MDSRPGAWLLRVSIAACRAPERAVTLPSAAPPSATSPPTAPPPAPVRTSRLVLDEGAMALLDLGDRRRIPLPSGSVCAVVDDGRVFVVRGAVLEALSASPQLTLAWRSPLPSETVVGDPCLGVVVTPHGIAVVMPHGVATFDPATGAMRAQARFTSKDLYVPVRRALDAPPLVAATADEVVVATARGPVAVPLGESVIDAHRTEAGPCVVTMAVENSRNPSRHVVCFSPSGESRFSLAVEKGGDFFHGTPWAWTDRHLLLGTLYLGRHSGGERIDLRTGARSVSSASGIVEDGERTLDITASFMTAPELRWSFSVSEVGARGNAPLWTVTPEDGGEAYACATIGSDLVFATSTKAFAFLERRARATGELVWKRTIELDAAPRNTYVRTDLKLEVLGDVIVLRALTGPGAPGKKVLHVLDAATGADAL